MHRRTCARHLAFAQAASLSAVTSLLPHSPGKCLLLQGSLQNPLPWGALLITLPDLGWLASRGRELTHVQGRDSLLEGLPPTEDMFQLGVVREEAHTKSI